MEKNEYEQFAYTRNPSFIRFGGDFFASTYRLPLMSVVLDLTPTLDEWFKNRQVARIIDSDPANTHLELERLKRMDMVEQRSSSVVQFRNYRRLDSARWDIVRVAVDTAKNELGL